MHCGHLSYALLHLEICSYESTSIKNNLRLVLLEKNRIFALMCNPWSFVWSPCMMLLKSHNDDDDDNNTINN